MAGSIEAKSADLKDRRTQNGVREELFRYLHPSPSCVTEEFKEEGGITRIRCNTHSVISGPVLEVYISK